MEADMQRISRTFVFVASLIALAFMPVAARAGNHWKFIVVNKSSSAVTSFTTQEDDEWSDNWLNEKIRPGDEFTMDFGTDQGDCVVRTKIKFTDGTYFDDDVNYCKVTRLYIHEKSVSLLP
jgi:hypothetical protein